MCSWRASNFVPKAKKHSEKIGVFFFRGVIVIAHKKRYDERMKIIPKKLMAVFAGCALVMSASAKTSFNENLSADEKARLSRGEVVIVNTGNTKKICLETDNATAKELISVMKSLKPAYFAEVLQVKPYRGNEDLIARIQKELLDVEGYAGIPYYSVRHDKWYNLYDWAKIVSRSTTAKQTQVVADVYMAPFGQFQADISLENRGEEILYLFSNKTKMILEEKITAAGPQKMKSGIAVFRDGDNWILYGAGGVDALSLFFLRDRIETSFINRIKSFTVYFIQKVDSK